MTAKSPAGRLVRMEWHVDTEQWRKQVWAVSSGLTMDELRAMLAQPGGFQTLIEHTLAQPHAACPGGEGWA